MMNKANVVAFTDKCRLILAKHLDEKGEEISSSDIFLEWEVSGEQGDKALLRVRGNETTYYEATRPEGTERVTVEIFKKCGEFTSKGE
ncbi:DUF6275 family protein [Cuneatibacter caecimuris]|uniref:Uncharacterized protein n=1 Tax=Cuneatibacter caecimuris TaxID=1796618 RepID=A0A4Q7PPN5_9FIRM|nr:DUF6275 family protein [Cuneatibacter caecimuris]RZT02892.1 hypothetical protein EV209_1022 [Cuneatibacter caecimuris]